MVKQVDFPTITEITEEEIDQALKLVQDSSLPDNIKKLIIKSIELAIWLPNFILNTKISMHRFTTMIFGKGYSRGENKDTQKNKAKSDLDAGIPLDKNSSTGTITTVAELSLKVNTSQVDKNKRPGHGRMPYTVYSKRVEIKLKLESKIGDPCPYLCGLLPHMGQIILFVNILHSNFKMKS